MISNSYDYSYNLYISRIRGLEVEGKQFCSKKYVLLDQMI